jgi:hypothetical protein
MILKNDIVDKLKSDKKTFKYFNKLYLENINIRITISFNIKIKPNGLTQDVNNTVFLFIFW